MAIHQDHPLQRPQYGEPRLHPVLLTQRMAVIDNELYVLYPVNHTHCSAHRKFGRKMRCLSVGMNQVQNHLGSKEHMNRVQDYGDRKSIVNLTIVSLCEYCEPDNCKIEGDVEAHFQTIHNLKHYRDSDSTDLKTLKPIGRVFKAILSAPDHVVHQADMYDWIKETIKELKDLLSCLMTQKKDLKQGFDTRSPAAGTSEKEAHKALMKAKTETAKDVRAKLAHLKQLLPNYEPYVP